jgi:serine/threonine protein kinase/tetratricopeptide (TPR) repeat protein
MSLSDPRVQSIFHDALTRAAEEREAFITTATRGDESLRADVHRLLAEHDPGGTYFDRPIPPAIEATLACLKPEEAGDVIGSFKLLELIGEGGFGSVWVADQNTPVRRRVALKILKLGMNTHDVIARFEQERQALAMMDHPNIARVFDAGATQWGRPFFAMELVTGVKLTDYCDAQRLTTEERVKLFIHVCHAVQHAHQKGIIHRDLKPSNILVTTVDGEAVPKVIDFGVAKALFGKLGVETVYTLLEQVIGTPLYMSPEQTEMAPLDIDTRCDIYSLGVLLYELLTGHTPIDQETLARVGLDEIRRVIREVDPPRPSLRVRTLGDAELTATAKRRKADPRKLPTLLSGDLDWIVMKCLEKDRRRRYETANGLAQDLQRHLANEPVLAAAPSTTYRFCKFARRNRAALGAAALITVVLVAATIISAWQAIRARNAEISSENRRIDSEASKARALAAEKDAVAKAAAERAAREESEAISGFLVEIFQSPDPERDGRNVTVAETLARAVRKLDDLSAHPDRRVKLEDTIAWTYHGLGLYQEAVPLFEKVRAYRLVTLGPEHPETLSAVHNLALCYTLAGNKDEALKLQEELLPLRVKVNGPEHHDTLSAMHNLAFAYASAGRLNEALKLREELLPLRRKVNGPLHPDTVRAVSGLAASYEQTGRQDKALLLREEVLKLLRKIHGPEKLETITAMESVAASYRNVGRWEEAIKMGEDAVKLFTKVNGPEHPDTISCMHNLANAYDGAGRKDEALKLREAVLPLRRKANAPDHPDTIGAMTSLANSYENAGRKDEAIKLREEVLTLHTRKFGPDHSETLLSLQYLGNAYAAAGRKEEALQLREKVLVLRRKASGPEHDYTLRAMASLADSYETAGRNEDAIKLRKEVVEIRRKLLSADQPSALPAMESLALALDALARSHNHLGRREDAAKLWEEALPLFTRANGSEHVQTLGTMQNISNSYDAIGRRDEALTLRETLFSLRCKVLGPAHVDTLRTMSLLANSYYAADRFDEALQLREDGLALSSRALGAEHIDTLGASTNLAISYGNAGRLSDAIALQEQTLAIKHRVLPPNHPFLAVALGNMADLYAKVADSFLQRGDFISAVSSLDDLVARATKMEGPEGPSTAAAMEQLAKCYIWQDRFSEAVPILKKVVAFDRKSNTPRKNGDAADRWVRLAAVSVAAGEMDEYQATCREMIDGFGGTRDGFVAERLFKTCSIAPNCGVPLTTIRQFLEMAEPMKKTTAQQWYYASAAMAEFRAGQWPVAKDLARNVSEKGIAPSTVSAALLAMVCQQEGKPEEARALLTKARAQLGAHWPPNKNNDGGPWHEWLIARLLVLEAGKMIEPPSSQ